MVRRTGMAYFLAVANRKGGVGCDSATHYDFGGADEWSSVDQRLVVCVWGSEIAVAERCGRKAPICSVDIDMRL